MAALVVEHGAHQRVPLLPLGGGSSGLVHPVRHHHLDAGHDLDLFQLAAAHPGAGLQLPGKLVTGHADMASGLGRPLFCYLPGHTGDILPKNPIKLEIHLDIRLHLDAGIMRRFGPDRSSMEQECHHENFAHHAHLCCPDLVDDWSVILINNQRINKRNKRLTAFPSAVIYSRHKDYVPARQVATPRPH
ncbi:hypothetical protein AERO9A_310029 [Aeromonas salmonicida]|nr:hypothetical protein AERO9A_310029 [Aeromonas salmonicida]